MGSNAFHRLDGPWIRRTGIPDAPDHGFPPLQSAPEGAGTSYHPRMAAPAPDRSPVDIRTDLEDMLADRRRRLETALADLDRNGPDLLAVVEAVGDVVRRGGRVVTCGNGGSAAEALHLSEELLGRYRTDRPSIASTCLNADPTAITCIANDFGFEAIFSRQCESLLQPGDGLVVFTTSGRSPNLVRALQTAADRGATRIGFLGGDGGEARPLCDASITIAGPDSAAIQEVHQFVMHAACEQFEPAPETHGR